MYIRDIMKRNVTTCRLDNSAEDVALMMWNNDCGSIPVVDDSGKALGMITDRDICMATALQKKPAYDIRVADIMSRHLFSCQSDNDVKHAMKTMANHRVKRLPITNGSGQVEGILSIDDIIASAERGARGITSPELSFDDAVITMKSVCNHHQ